MRLGLIVAAALLAVLFVGSFYFVDVDQTAEGRLPDVDVTVEDSGKLPEYDVETGDIAIETEKKVIEVPTVEVTPPPAD